MGKEARLRRIAGDNAKESIGAGRAGGPKTLVVHAPPENLGRIQAARDFLEIPVDLIDRDPKQPRKTFDPDALKRLARNLRKRSQLQAIRVIRKGTTGRFTIVAGERRWRAAQEAGIATLVCKVLDRRPTEAETRAEQLAENCAREDMPPMELAAALDELRQETGWDQGRVAEEVGLSQGGVSQKLSLLKLPPPVRDLVAAGRLPETTALEVLRLPGVRDKVDLAREAADDGWTRDRVRHAVAQLLAANNRGRLCEPPDDAAIRESVEASAEGGIATAAIESHRLPIGKPAAETGGGGRKEPPGKAATDSPSAPTPPPPGRLPWVTPYSRHGEKGDEFTYQVDGGAKVTVFLPADGPDRSPVAALEAVLAEARRHRYGEGPSS